jgi:Cu2+-exporting ATPase
VRTVVFDKTGTLTVAAAAVQDPEALRALQPAALQALAHLVQRSSHPKAVAVRAALVQLGLAATTATLDAPVTERAGLGIEVAHAGATYRLGAPGWATSSRAPAESNLLVSADGRVVAAMSVREALRADAADEVAALLREGFDVWLLSGDDPARVLEVAERCGLPADHARGGASPHAKDAWLQAHDHRDVLMIGDGINDALAVEHAFCSGTPAIDRPFMAAHSDFYFVTPGLAPIRTALHAAKAVAWVRSMNLTIAVCYNAFAVGLAYAGLLSPLLCAVFMPLSSLTTLGATRIALSPGSRLWKS